MLSRRFIFSLLASLVLLSACGTSEVNETTTTVASTSTVPAFSAKLSDFSPCGQIECASFEVPVSRDGSSSDSILLRVYRRQGSAQGAQFRPLFVHPGGPGASVEQLIKEIPQFLGTAVEHFTVIGLSTRGSQDGTQAYCVSDLDLIVKSSSSPTAAETVAQQCVKNSPRLIGHAGTLDSVDDLEDLRRALKFEDVNYLGWSYGATLGAAWQMLYPSSLKHVVLDAPADPSIPWNEQFAKQLSAQQEAFSRALSWCSTESSCAAQRDPMAVVNAARKAAESTDDQSQMATVALSMAIELQLYSADYKRLFAAISNGAKGQFQQLITLADARLGRTSGGDNDGGIHAQLLVRCSDLSHSDARQTLQTWQSFSPSFVRIGIGAAYERVCLELPESNRPLENLEISPGASKDSVLVFAASGDPVIPASVSQTLADKMGWGFQLVPGFEHLSVGLDGSATSQAVQCLRNGVCSSSSSLNDAP